MVCRYYSGNHNSQTPTRIVCSGFKNSVSAAVGIPATETIRFFFSIINPDISVQQTYVPVQIYSMNTADQSRTNYNYLEKGLYITATAMSAPILETSPINIVGDQFFVDQFATLQLKVSNEDPLTKDDFYIIRFTNLVFTNNDPNMKLNLGAVTYSNPNNVAADIAFCKNLRLMVIYPGAIEIP